MTQVETPPQVRLADPPWPDDVLRPDWMRPLAPLQQQIEITLSRAPAPPVVCSVTRGAAFRLACDIFTAMDVPGASWGVRAFAAHVRAIKWLIRRSRDWVRFTAWLDGSSVSFHDNWPEVPR